MKYNIVVQTLAVAGEVQIIENCLSLTIVNAGDVQCYFNGVPLPASPVSGQLGQSISIGGNESEIFVGRISISFDSTAGVKKCVVIQRIKL